MNKLLATTADSLPSPPPEYRKRGPDARRAFTLVELLVVIGIIALLIAILLPALNRARKIAAEVKSLSGMRQLMYGYTAYHVDNRGDLLYGYTPDTIAGKAVKAEDVRSGNAVTGQPARRYPWRLLKYCSNVWPIIHAHAAIPPLPQRGDDAATVSGKAYSLSVNPTYGINATFVGGSTDMDGFVDTNTTPGGPPMYTPNRGKHIAFKTTDVHRPTELIVFTDAYSTVVQTSTNEVTGFHVAMPPRAGGLARWTVDPAKGVAVSLRGAELIGVPHGWFTKNVVTGFFDGHAEARRPDQLLDMRLWCDRAASPDYDYK